MENDYRITKLHGTLIGDNRIPDLPAGEKTKVFSSTNGKTAWVDLPEGGKSVSPCLNLMNMEDITVRTSITEEEKTNLEKGLYNSVFYADLSLGPVADNSVFFPEPLVQVENRYVFSFYTFSFDETTQKASIDGTTTKNIQVGEKNSDGTYQLIISDEFNEAIPFGGGGGGASVSPCLNLMNMEDSGPILRTSITEEEKTNLEKGLYNSVLYADPSKGNEGTYSMYFPETMANIIQGSPFFSVYDLSVDGESGNMTVTGTSVYVIAVEEEKNADGTYPISVQKAINGTFGSGGGGGGGGGGITTIKSLPFPQTIHSTEGFELLWGTIDGGDVIYAGNVKGKILNYSLALAYTSINPSAQGEETFATLTGLFEGYGYGVMELKKDANNIPQFKSFTTWLPPITSADEGKSLVIKNGNAQWTDLTSIHNHTIVIKEGSKIIFAANKDLSSATPATTLETLISTFKDTTTAGFGDYILLTVDTAAKLTKQDGTETDLSTLTVTISDTVK